MISLFQVYIKDIGAKKLTSPVASTVALKNVKTIGTTTIRQTQQKTKTFTQNTTSTTSSDFLSSIIKAVGIHVGIFCYTFHLSKTK